MSSVRKTGRAVVCDVGAPGSAAVATTVVKQTIGSKRKSGHTGEAAASDAQSITLQLQLFNDFLTCPLCDGYFRNAVTLTECLHTFCKSCIYIRFWNTHSQKCPVCGVDLGPYPTYKLRSDHLKQAIIEKVFPETEALEAEVEREYNARWYQKHGVNPGDSFKHQVPITAPRPRARPFPTPTGPLPAQTGAPGMISSPDVPPSAALPPSAGAASGDVGTDTGAWGAGLESEAAAKAATGATATVPATAAVADAAPPTTAPGDQHEDDASDALNFNLCILAHPTRCKYNLQFERPYLKTASRANVMHLKKYLVRKLGLDDFKSVTVYFKDHKLEDRDRLREVVAAFAGQKVAVPLFWFNISQPPKIAPYSTGSYPAGHVMELPFEVFYDTLQDVPERYLSNVRPESVPTWFRAKMEERQEEPAAASSPPKRTRRAPDLVAPDVSPTGASTGATSGEAMPGGATAPAAPAAPASVESAPVAGSLAQETDGAPPAPLSPPPTAPGVPASGVRDAVGSADSAVRGNSGSAAPLATSPGRAEVAKSAASGSRKSASAGSAAAAAPATSTASAAGSNEAFNIAILPSPRNARDIRLDKPYLRTVARAMGEHLMKHIRNKLGLAPTSPVEITFCEHPVDRTANLRAIVNRYRPTAARTCPVFEFVVHDPPTVEPHASGNYPPSFETLPPPYVFEETYGTIPPYWAERLASMPKTVVPPSDTRAATEPASAVSAPAVPAAEATAPAAPTPPTAPSAPTPMEH